MAWKDDSNVIVKSWNEWDPLKHVVVGVADFHCVPAPEPGLNAKIPEDSDMRGQYGPRPLHTVEAANAQLDNLVSILEKRGIKVDRPTPIQWNRAIATPDWSCETMYGCMSPRENILTVGREMLEGTMSYRCHFFEYLAHRPLLNKWSLEDPGFRWESCPKPRLTDASFRPDYLSDHIGIEQRLKWMNERFYVTTEEEPLVDPADPARFGKDLFVQHGFTTNMRGIDWLQRHFPDHRVHAVNFPGDPYPIHIDATFTPVRPGLILNNPNRRLDPSQRKIFDDNDWEIVDAAQPAHDTPPPLCYSSVWLSMNCLVLDPKTVCVEASEVYQQEQFDKLGFEVIPVPFRDAYPFGGGLHCATYDVYREGDCEDYFPNQSARIPLPRIS